MAQGRNRRILCFVANESAERGFIPSAQQALATAQANLDSGDTVASINRSYYAIFYAASALLQRSGLFSSKHSGVLAMFRENFVKTGQIGVEFGTIYGTAFAARMESDYDIDEWPAVDMAQQILDGARNFVSRIEQELGQLP